MTLLSPTEFQILVTFFFVGGGEGGVGEKSRLVLFPYVPIPPCTHVKIHTKTLMENFENLDIVFGDTVSNEWAQSDCICVTGLGETVV